MNDLLAKTDVRIPSTEIADRTGKQHKHVLQDIRLMFKALEVDETPYLGTYTDVQGKEHPCFYLTRYYALILTTGYDVKLREKVVAFFEEHHERPAPKRRQLLPQFQLMNDLVEQLNDHEIMLMQTQDDVRVLEGEVARVRKIAGDAENFMSIKAYINLNGIYLPPRSTGPIGKACSKYCRENSIPITTVPDATYGKLNVYPVVVVKEAVDQFLIKLNKEK